MERWTVEEFTLIEESGIRAQDTLSTGAFIVEATTTLSPPTSIVPYHLLTTKHLDMSTTSKVPLTESSRSWLAAARELLLRIIVDDIN